MPGKLARLSARDLARFERSYGIPAAFRILRRHLGLWRAARMMIAFVARRSDDPLAGVPATDWPMDQEQLCRIQLRPVFHLDDIAREVLRMEESAREALLRDIIVELGAVFVERMLPVPDPGAWRRMNAGDRDELLRSLGARMFNARLGAVRATERDLSLDVVACRFVELCHAAGREHLARHFCDADSRHFDSAESLVELRRSGTLARGAALCDFRFRYRS